MEWKNTKIEINWKIIIFSPSFITNLSPLLLSLMQ